MLIEPRKHEPYAFCSSCDRAIKRKALFVKPYLHCTLYICRKCARVLVKEITEKWKGEFPDGKAN